MVKKLVAGMLTLALLGAPIVANAATSVATHVHTFVKPVYLYTTQENIYAHDYVSGTNPETGKVYYDTCLIIQEAEHYDKQCTVSGCTAKEGAPYIKLVDCHSACGLGDVRH